ncbi:MAG: FAD:protein FMN transferase [Campylobacterota bacterium]|nr:FAD:protein FMN transferase [Campylobacterota bacterium]
MRKKFISTLMLLSFCISLSASQNMLVRSRLSMGTIAKLSAPNFQKEILQTSFERLKEIEKSLSSYDKKALVYQLNNSLHVRLNEDIYKALELSKNYYKRSDGYFNIMIGAITKDAYSFGEDEKVPSFYELDLSKISFDGLSFDKNEANLSAGFKVDLGGMGKGFGVDEVYKLYLASDVKKGLIALSGDIRCIDNCSIEIQNPFAEGIIGGFRSLKSGLAISTSGNYRRFVKEKKNHHLINPKDKRPAKSFASITLVSYTSSADLDAYATAASVMPREKALKFLDALFIHRKRRK